jgi:hypothetical protein
MPCTNAIPDLWVKGSRMLLEVAGSAAAEATSMETEIILITCILIKLELYSGDDFIEMADFGEKRDVRNRMVLVMMIMG